jgi:hypothetical protein
MALLEQAGLLEIANARARRTMKCRFIVSVSKNSFGNSVMEETVKADVVKQRAWNRRLGRTSFRDLYQRDFAKMKRLQARIIQVSLGLRTVSSAKNNSAQGDQLALLLAYHGVGDRHSNLSVVHMRNVPPNPANCPAIGPGRTERPSSLGIYLLFRLLRTIAIISRRQAALVKGLRG